MKKQDTPLKPTVVSKSTSSRGPDKSTTLVSNEDIMSALQEFKKEFVSSNKSIKDELKLIRNQMNELKTENSRLRCEVNDLKGKI